MLLRAENIQPYLRPEIVLTLKEGKTISISSLPAVIMLPLIVYFPFWSIIIFTTHVLRALEKRRKIHSPIYQQEI